MRYNERWVYMLMNIAFEIHDKDCGVYNSLEYMYGILKLKYVSDGRNDDWMEWSNLYSAVIFLLCHSNTYLKSQHALIGLLSNITNMAQNDLPTDLPIDRPTDGRTDRPTDRHKGPGIL